MSLPPPLWAIRLSVQQFMPHSCLIIGLIRWPLVKQLNLKAHFNSVGQFNSTN